MEFLKSTQTSKLLLILNVLLSITYFIFIALVFPIGNLPLFVLLR